MTRFARAKGSKASNERVCEDATPWEEMKSQLLQKKTDQQDEAKRKEAEEMRNLNYQNFLKEREEKLAGQTQWAEFPNTIKTQSIEKKSRVSAENKSKKRKSTLVSENEIDSGIETKVESGEKRKKKKKKPKNSSSVQPDAVMEKEVHDSSDEAPIEISSKQKNSEPEIKPTKVKKKKLKIVLDQESQNDSWKGLKAVEGEEVQNSETKAKNSFNKVLKNIDLDSLPEDEKKKVLKKQERRRKQVEKKKLKKQQLKEQEQQKNNVNSSQPTEKEHSNTKQKKFNKEFDKSQGRDSNSNKVFPKKNMKTKDGEFKRRKDFQPNKFIVNGKEVDLEYYDGFPIKKEDAQNLKKLRKEMISKGLPRSEINRTLKLERRKAEKALTREKKKVCFNCRKFGHNLSECPDISSKNGNELIDTSGTGICFKCGSTEHTSFACRVVQGQSFKFATCFICKEQGHISRQCPDNARGLYPKGGACKVCGDVTHLKKDCPQFQVHQEKEQDKFRIGTFGGGNPEDFDEGNVNVKKSEVAKPNKIITF